MIYLFIFLNLPGSQYTLYSPDCLNPPQPFFYLSKEIGKLKWEKKIFPGSMFGKKNMGSDLIFLQREAIVLMTWTVLHKAVGYVSVHVNGGLKEHEIDISGTKQDVDFKIVEDLAEDSPTQSLFL